jgi:hypothetical protein
MVTSPHGIHAAMYLSSCGERPGGKMQNAAIFFVGNFRDGDLLAIGLQHSKIVDLAAACWIKSGTVKHDGGSAIADERFDHAGVEVVKKRVVVIEAVSHKSALSH